MGLLRSLGFGRTSLLCRSSFLLVTLHLIHAAATTRAARSLTPTWYTSAPAPAPSSIPCACNPSLMATNGTCAPLRLSTPWSCDVDPANPLPEYPRPHLVRQDWQSLNGLWEWQPAPTFDAGLPPFNRTLARKIVVPFPVQSDLSGVPAMYTAGISRMWYRRTFTIPASWASLSASHRTLLNFGAVDWESEVWVNGVRLGLHRGGYDKFSYDITDALAKSGAHSAHELIVRVFDPTEFAHIPIGKQRLHAPGTNTIFYTGSSGIWQTVWLEPVADQHMTRLDIIPDIDASRVQVTVQGSASAVGLPVTVQVGNNNKAVAVGEGMVGAPFNISIPSPSLWSPQDPHLYNVFATLHSDNTTSFIAVGNPQAAVLDKVESYAGMRKIALGQSYPDGPLRIFLNNKPILQLGLLDQGFWPDGLYTASSDAALAADIEMALSLNLTTLRKHIKVEPDRWYYHADRLGMLVWQDMPAMFFEDPFQATDGVTYRQAGEKAQFEAEMKRMIEEHFSNPSIITYITFNEGWGEYEPHRIVQQAKAWDPSRLFTAASGWVDPQDATSGGGWRYDHYPGYVGDLRDDHHYPDPISSGVTATRASVAGEFGGLGYFVGAHTWIGSSRNAFSAYPLMDNVSQLEDSFVALIGKAKDLFNDASKGLSAAIYTEVSDCEDELNGLFTYDRRVLKFNDTARIANAIGDALTIQQLL